jgi:hypothetical protein
LFVFFTLISAHFRSILAGASKFTIQPLARSVHFAIFRSLFRYLFRSLSPTFWGQAVDLLPQVTDTSVHSNGGVSQNIFPLPK